MAKTRIIPPKWLGKVAQEKYSTLIKSLPKLDQTQLDMVAMMAEAHETYLQAAEELSKHCQETGSLCTQGSAGQSTPHPAFKIQTQATANYLKIAQQLRISLSKAVDQPQPVVSDELDSILGLE